MVHHVGRFVDRVSRISLGRAMSRGGFQHFFGFLAQLGSDALHSPGQQLAGVRLGAGLLFAVPQHRLELPEDGCSLVHTEGSWGWRFAVREKRVGNEPPLLGFLGKAQGDNRPGDSIYLVDPGAQTQMMKAGEDFCSAKHVEGAVSVSVEPVPAPEWVKGCWILSGPTASGKTEVGLALAQLLHAEIVSLDSMALYRRLDIGTAKPSPEQRRQVPHHMLDVLEPHQEASVAWYLQQAQQAVAEIRRRGRVPLFVGGTPLYLVALLRGLSTGPSPDPELRRRLHQQARQLGPQALHAQLAQVDPQAAARLHPNDLRRVVRALEFYHRTGRPISQVQAHFHRPRCGGQVQAWVLQWPRDVLYRRIDQRVREMFRRGWVEEVRRLLAEDALGPTARQAVGYREIAEHLEGRLSHEQMVRRIQQRTRRYAKHQLTWFRRLQECRTVPVTQADTPEQLARQIVRQAEESGQIPRTDGPGC